MAKRKISIQLGPELSDRELLAIGRIVSGWGFLEFKIFYQAAQALLDTDRGDLPKAMNNIQFTGVLALWKQHVIEKAKGRRKAKLEKVYDRIIKCIDYRNALVHGMWEWDPSAPEKISAIRIRKKQVVTVQFTASDLENFANTLGEINHDVEYPGGARDYAAQMAARGSYLSRRGLALWTGHPIIKDFFPTLFDR